MAYERCRHSDDTGGATVFHYIGHRPAGPRPEAHQRLRSRQDSGHSIGATGVFASAHRCLFVRELQLKLELHISASQPQVAPISARAEEERERDGVIVVIVVRPCGLGPPQCFCLCSQYATTPIG